MKRDQTEEEVILRAGEKSFSTFDELVEACLPILTARIWETCCWPKEMGLWKIGDFNYLIVSVYPKKDVSLFVQYWSEPHELVCAEVCSGSWNPPALEHIRSEQRSKIEGFGYSLDEDAPNFQKDVSIASPEEAEAAAREALEILFNVFGYRGQWALETRSHRGERAEHIPVHTSVTPNDVCKIAEQAGFSTELAELDHAPVVLLRRGRRRSVVQLYLQVPDNNLYCCLHLRRKFRFLNKLPEPLLCLINGYLPAGSIVRDTGGTELRFALFLDGGVTTEWLIRQFLRWNELCRNLERLVKALKSDIEGASTDSDTESVH